MDRRELTVVEDLSLVLKSQGPRCGLTLRFSPHFKSFYFVMFTVNPIPCPTTPLPNQLKFFLLTSFLAFLPHTWKYPQLLWQQEADCFLKIHSLIPSPILPQVVSLLLLHLQLPFPTGLPYCFPHYEHLCFQSSCEHIFRWIKTVYHPLGSCYPAYHLPSLKPYFVVSFD